MNPTDHIEAGRAHIRRYYTDPEFHAQVTIIRRVIEASGEDLIDDVILEIAAALNPTDEEKGRWIQRAEDFARVASQAPLLTELPEDFR